MAEIHSFIYGIDSDFLVRKVTVSRETGATYITLNPPHGSDRIAARHCRRPPGCSTSAKQQRCQLISMKARSARRFAPIRRSRRWRGNRSAGELASFRQPG